MVGRGSAGAAAAATLGAVPAQQIAQNLAYINWTVLTGLAFGALAAGVVGRARTEAPRGYLAFTALCAAAFAGLAYLSDAALPASVAGSRLVADPAFDVPRRIAIARHGHPRGRRARRADAARSHAPARDRRGRRPGSRPSCSRRSRGAAAGSRRRCRCSSSWSCSDAQPGACSPRWFSATGTS